MSISFSGLNFPKKSIHSLKSSTHFLFIMFQSPKKAVIVASLTAFTLAIIKFIGGLMTGSLTVMSSSIDSLLDFFVSIINFFAIKKSMQNHDDEYHYGYGKIE